MDVQACQMPVPATLLPALTETCSPSYTHPVTKDANKLSKAAAMMGKIGGPKGGRARAQKLSPERRKAIARKAAHARWAGEKAKKKLPPPENT